MPCSHINCVENDIMVWFDTLVARIEASILVFDTMQVLYWPVLGQIQFCSIDRRCKTCLDTKPVLYQDRFCSLTRGTGDLRRHRDHYDITVMNKNCSTDEDQGSLVYGSFNSAYLISTYPNTLDLFPTLLYSWYTCDNTVLPMKNVSTNRNR